MGYEKKPDLQRFRLRLAYSKWTERFITRTEAIKAQIQANKTKTKPTG